MHRLFYPLDRKRAALLLTLMTHGGANELGLLELLDDPALGDMKEKAQLLLQLPGDKRAIFFASEIKKLVSELSDRGLENVDPSWVVSALVGENPKVIAGLLIGFSSHYLKAIIEKMPSEVRRTLPPKDALKTVPPELITAMRLQFEQRFAPMPMLAGKTFGFREVVCLEPKELSLLLRSLGLEELAQAFVSVGRYALAELCKRLPRDYASELIEVVKRTNQQDAMELKSAQRFLGRVLVNFTDTEELSRKAGMWRLSKALSIENPDYLRSFFQRMPKTWGQTLETYIAKVQELAEADEQRARRFQDQILHKVNDMAKNSLVSPRYLELEFQYHAAEHAA